MYTKKANCIREVENWSLYKNEHKIDNKAYNPEIVLKDLPIVSPKIESIIKNIYELDKKDKEESGKLYKHMIFSDLRSAGGAKSIASALIAKGFHLIYNDKLQIDDPIIQTPYNFALLTSTKLYDKTIGIRFRRTLLTKYNERPDNTYGDNIRFIILDFGFKEGIDLFDIKYIHILETPVSNADKKQIIGRGTRFCGQKGLEFDVEKGWPLYVYQYRTIIPNSVRDKFSEDILFDIFMKKSNIDRSLNTFGFHLDRIAIQASVDLHQNYNIHSISPEFDSLYNEVNNMFNTQISQFDTSRKYTTYYGLKIRENEPINCRNGCKGAAMSISPIFMLIVWYMMSKKPIYINEKRFKPFLCKQIVENKEYCKSLNAARLNQTKYIIDNEKSIMEMANKLPVGPTTQLVFANQQNDIRRYIDKIISSVILPPKPPTSVMSYYDLQYYIYNHYKQFTWEKPKMENLCIEKKEDEDTKESKKANKLEFTPTQNFVREYFKPKSPYKGLLLWHSVGTGKTCTAIATATTGFEKKGYTILWVTRHTLKNDIWKNMYRQVCSLTIRDKIGKEISVEDAIKKPLQYVSDRWMEPITYKQFSNLLMKRNKYYTQLSERNGIDDPLHKTLIIIDEAHKLLSSDLPPQERPNYEVLKQFIQNSYDISGKDSVRVLLMTATPYTTNPMNMIKLINLLKETDKFPEDYEIFKQNYLNEDGYIKDPMNMINKLSGYISYLNREKDIRQFAIPQVKTINVPLSISNVAILEEKLKLYTEEYDKHNKTLEDYDKDIIAFKKQVSEQLNTLLNNCSNITNKSEQAQCKKEIKNRAASYKKEQLAIAQSNIDAVKKQRDDAKQNIRLIKKDLKDFKTNDLSQERLLFERCVDE